MSAPLKVLIAEDDVDIASTLSRGMRREGYEPIVAHDAAAALDAARRAPVDAAIVDMMLGADRGDDLVRLLRGAGMDGPILMLSALSAVEDRTDGMAAGADDYVAKPFEFRELMTRLDLHARMRARAREGRGRARSHAAPATGRRAGAFERASGPDAGGGLSCLTLDPLLRELGCGTDQRVSLTQRECELMSFLLAHATQLVSRGTIFDTLWAQEGGSSENVVDVYIGYLRRKLAQCDGCQAEIRTIRGRGFMLVEKQND